MILFIFGCMVLGSIFIVAGYTMPGWRRRFPLSIYNAGLAMALGMDLHALGMILQLYGRIEQMVGDGATFATDDPVYFVGSVMIIAGKSLFVWVAALGEGRTYSRPFWWSYWALLAVWLLVCWSFFA
ncbi:hypothetical protein E3U23_11125 [Erythrobacter litoralis]|uniref:hypothetical protein n=1 Tax=Erythrobacter litoralis TaxID=39960 RepID=UPI002434F1AE|nr:hypothetical protein [Erythrobacter litoralis]MDG6079740.1 hypothetical protein [Erythrobacter litoralis]